MSENEREPAATETPSEEPAETEAYFTLKLTDDGIGVLTMKAPGAGPNTMGRAWTEGLEAILDQVESDKDLKALVLISGHDDFLVGADLKEIG